MFSLNIVIQYWLLSILIHWSGQLSKPGFSNLPNFIPKSNYNKLVCITLIDFFYHFLTNTTKQDILYIISNIVAQRASYLALHSSLFGSVAQLIMIILSLTALTLVNWFKMYSHWRTY